jgi:alpha-tubulin suppressor-like RCC1 family protein
MITYRTTKGSSLTHEELDENFRYLDEELTLDKVLTNGNTSNLTLKVNTINGGNLIVGETYIDEITNLYVDEIKSNANNLSINSGDILKTNSLGKVLANNFIVQVKQSVFKNTFSAYINQPYLVSNTWSKIATGYIGHSLAIRSDGILFAWGYGFDGQLGINEGGISGRSSPVQVGTSSWSQIDIGISRSLAIRSDGTLWSWGLNGGYLGTNDTTNRSSPTQIGTSSWSQISGGGYRTLAIRVDGTLWAWGFNSSGQLGLNDDLARSSPVQIGTNSNWSMIATGESCSFALDSTGNIWSWGTNSDGELGLNDTVHRSSPTQIGLYGVKFVGGTNGGTAITNNGGLWVWGSNYEGALGIGSYTNDNLRLSSPVQIMTDKTFKFAFHTNRNVFSIDENDDLYGSGSSSTGFFPALNTSTPRSSPVLIDSDKKWYAIGTRNNIIGTTHLLQILKSSDITANGSLWSWGRNGYGHLGLNDTVHRLSIVMVASPTLTTLSGSNVTIDEINCSFTPVSQNNTVKIDLSLFYGANSNSKFNINLIDKQTGSKVVIKNNWATSCSTDNVNFGIYGINATYFDSNVANTKKYAIEVVSDNTLTNNTFVTINRSANNTSQEARPVSSLTITEISGIPFNQFNVSTFAITSNVASVNEGDTVLYTVSTTQVANGTTLYWTNSGTTVAGDFLDSANSGSFVITNGTGTVTRTLTNDFSTEGVETIVLQVREGSISGTIVATANSVNVADTSTPPLPTTWTNTSITNSILGAASLTTSTTPTFGDYDDGYWTLSLPWNYNFNGYIYTQVFVGTNQYLTFGGGSINFSGLSASNPAFNKIMYSSGDRSVSRIYYGTEGTAPNRTYRIRSEGSADPSIPPSPTNIFEFVFYENNTGRIDIQIGVMSTAVFPGPSGVFSETGTSLVAFTPAANSGYNISNS